MAEAEDVLTDGARYATVFVRDLWRRGRASSGPPKPPNLRELAPRLDLLLTAVFGQSLPLRVAQPPLPPTLLARLFERAAQPRVERAIPATDDHAIWLPRELEGASHAEVVGQFRCMALTQAARARRGAAAHAAAAPSALVRSLYLLLEAHQVDRELAALLPGLAGELAARRSAALLLRPALSLFPPARRPLERLARDLIARPPMEPLKELGEVADPTALMDAARALAVPILHETVGERPAAVGLLFVDAWTGDLRPPSAQVALAAPSGPEERERARPTRSAHLKRRPNVRAAREGEDDEGPGAWMIQTSQPHEHAEDPFGMQRPADRDVQSAADEHADSLSELAEARLVATPGQAPEYLLSDEPLPLAAARMPDAAGPARGALSYPEWDYRSASYRDPGAWVAQLPSEEGSSVWVAQTLKAHAAMLQAIRSRFEVLRSRRTKLRKQEDGDELDLEAFVESYMDRRAGYASRQAIYQIERPARRDAAILLLVDVSGSTESWVAADKRVIDVEKEALLLVSMALGELRDPFAVLAFSGESKSGVAVRTLKRFEEVYGESVGRRIAALEPDAYTRTGAALRHASALLMQVPARHRLLLLLSDGKPNDVDEYEGRYGAEDTRQAVVEAGLQGIHPFCLTVDRQAAGYLQHIFGAGRYALLPRPELLPYALLDWIRRLLAS